MAKAVVWKQSDSAGSFPFKEIAVGEPLEDGDGVTIQPMVDGQNIFYVGKHGADTNDGKNWNKAFLTFTAAIAAASSGDTVVCLDSGTYTERVTVPAGINVFAPNATLVGPGGGSNTQGALNVNDGTCWFNKIENASGESCIVKLDTTGTAKVHVNEIEVVAGGVSFGVLAISTTQGGVLLVRADTINVGASCIGVGSITVDTSHVHIEAEDIYLNGDSAVGVAQAFTSGTMVARVGHILEMGTSTGTVAINIQDGVLDAIIGTITADTAWIVGASGTMDLFVASSTGTETETGTANVSKAGEAGATAWTGLSDTPGSITENKPVEGGSGALVFGPLNKVDGTQAPTADDDANDGYAPRSRWTDLTNDKEYVCLDATVANAVWKETTKEGGTTIAPTEDTGSGIGLTASYADTGLSVSVAVGANEYVLVTLIAMGYNNAGTNRTLNTKLVSDQDGDLFESPRISTDASAFIFQNIGWTKIIGPLTEATHALKIQAKQDVGTDALISDATLQVTRIT